MNDPSTCPHFSLCSGCEIGDFLHPPIWKEALTFFQKHQIEPKFVADGFCKTRLKSKLAVRQGPEIGLFKKGSHEVLSIPHCLVHHPAINRAVALIKKEMIDQKIAPYEENPPRGALRYIQLFVERSTGRLQLVLVSNGQDLDSFAESLLKYELWHSIWINVQPASTNRILGDQWRQIYGEPFLWQELNGIPVPFHPGAFSQAHLSLFEKMLNQIENWTHQNDRVLELYAGVGAIGLSIHHKTSRLTLVENNPYAYLSFQQTKKEIPYLCIDAKEANFSGYDLTIVDPPRKGLDPQVIEKIESQRLIYVSCGFDSFKRDAEKLFLRGWKLKEASGYLLFPGTNHVETVALFSSSGV